MRDKGTDWVSFIDKSLEIAYNKSKEYMEFAERSMYIWKLQKLLQKGR